MLITRHFTWLPLGIVALMLLAMVPPHAAHAAQAGPNSYESDLGYTITWSDEWSYDETFSLQSEGTFDLVTLWNTNSDFLMITGVADGNITPASLLEPAAGDEVITSELEAEVPRLATESSDGFRSIAEGYELAESGVVITVSLTSTPESYDASLAQVQEDVQINASPVLTGEPLSGDEATGETPRTTRTGTGEAAAGLETYVGPVYGYSFDYDAELWTAEDEHTGDDVDGLSLSSPTSSLTIWGWNGYGGDPVACLDGEAAYYATEVEGISDWEQLEDADGNPLRRESEESAWGVFGLTHENAEGNQTPLVDYIGCQPIPGQDAVLIVLLSSVPETYNDNLDLTFDILDTLQFGDATAQPVVTEPPTEPTAEPTTAVAEPTAGATEPASQPAGTRTEIDTNFDGALYTSPTYGFSVYVPLEWTIVSETAEGADERLALSNGTSELTLWATNAAVGDLSGCVDYAAANSGKNLSLLQNSTGGDFRGVTDEEAFANYVYDANGVQMMYFVGCRPIPGTDGVLIVIQDVEFSKFTSERRSRTDIEESITMP